MRRIALVCSLFASLAVFYAATIRQGNRWGDDFALYIHHAQNIVRGQPYADTGFIYNPAAPEYSPRMYPPVFPLLLTPLLKLFGLNFTLMKLEEAAFFLLALVAVYFLWRRALQWPYLLALIFILGFNPVFWDAKDDLLSDLPFLFFFYAAALIVQFAPRDAKAGWKWAMLGGLVLYLCIGTRGIGLTLLAGLLLYDLLTRRRISAFTVIAIALAGGLTLIQRWLTGPGLSSYADQFHPTLALFWHNTTANARSLLAFWLVRRHRFFSLPLYAALTILVLAGFRCQLRRGLTIVEAFLAPYLLLVMLWSVTGVWRFLFPVVPFFVYLVLTGLQHLTASLRREHALLALAGLVLLVSSSYLLTYHDMDFGPIPESDRSPSFTALCDAVRKDTAPGDVFIYRRARALALFTSRRAATYEPGNEAALWSCARRIHASYVIASGRFPEDREFLIPSLAKHAAALKLIYRNPDFALYRIRTLPDLAVQAAAAGTAP